MNEDNIKEQSVNDICNTAPRMVRLYEENKKGELFQILTISLIILLFVFFVLIIVAIIKFPFITLFTLTPIVVIFGLCTKIFGGE